MIGKGLRYIVLLFGLSLLCGSCAVNKTAWDLTEYINQGMLNIAELEQKSLEIYASATGDRFKSDEHLAAALKNQVVPYYKRFLDGLRAIHPKEKEVQDLHILCLNAAESLYNGFKILLLGLESKDPATLQIAVQSANQKIQQGREANQKWRELFTELAKKHKVLQGKKKPQ
jgi:hypothetical protein